MGSKPLVSIPLLVYQNAHLIHDAIDSVAEQDYENIELIISDDCSGDFNQQEVADYVKSRNRGNISRLVINENRTNLGTVRHCNRVLGLAQGMYLKFISENALYDGKVISDFVSFFEQTDALVVASQCVRYDETMTHALAPALSDRQIEILRTLPPGQLFLELIQNDVVCALGVAFSRIFFEKYGPFDEHYRIDEDRPMWLRISRQGCPIHYMDRVTAKFRSGGISKHDSRSYERPRTWYVEDLIRIWNLEILPYRDMLGDALWRKLLLDYLRQYEWPLTFSEPSPVRFF